MNQIKKHLPAIIRVFKQHRVVLGLLFGSTVAGRTTRRSDLDFAVLLPESVSKKKYLDIQLSLMSQLNRIFKKKIDVVVLNNASPFLAQMAIVNGRVLYCSDDNLKAQFFTRTLQGFEDASYLAKTYNRYLNQRVLTNRLGEKL